MKRAQQAKNFKSTSLITRRKDQQRFSEINSGYRTSVWLSVCHLLLFCCFACFFFLSRYGTCIAVPVLFAFVGLV